MKTRYEYRIVRFDVKWNVMATRLGADFADLERQLNVLGVEGWELVKTSEILTGGTTVAIISTFKRTNEN